MGFRFGPLPLILRVIARKILHAMVHPDSLPVLPWRARHTRTPSDLTGHAVIISPAQPSSTFSRKDGRIGVSRVDSRAPAVTLDEAAIAGAVAGLGIAASSMPREEIENGSLVHVLPDWDFGIDPGDQLRCS